MRIVHVAMLALMAAGTFGGAVGLAENLCDPGLEGNDDSAIAYQARGDRCEGIYKLQVNSTQLRLSSITEVFEAFDAASPQDLRVTWSPPKEIAAARVRLRATSLNPRTYYRMDTAVPAAPPAFAWSLDIVDQLGFSREDLGVLGWIAHPDPPKDDRREIFLPLRIVQKGTAARTGLYEVAFVPEVRLEEVFVTVAPVDVRGDPVGPPIKSDKPLEYGYYPANEPTVFEVSELGKSGLYEVLISTRFHGQGSGTLGFYLYHEEM